MAQQIAQRQYRLSTSLRQTATANDTNSIGGADGGDDFYVENLLSTLKEAETDERLETILNTLYKLYKDGKELNCSQLQKIKTIRDKQNNNKSAPVAEYKELLKVLEELGFVKLETENRKINITLNPNYRPT